MKIKQLFLSAFVITMSVASSIFAVGTVLQVRMQDSEHSQQFSLDSISANKIAVTITPANNGKFDLYHIKAGLPDELVQGGMRSGDTFTNPKNSGATYHFSTNDNDNPFNTASGLFTLTGQ